jgi:hypothetical protein
LRSVSAPSSAPTDRLADEREASARLLPPRTRGESGAGVDASLKSHWIAPVSSTSCRPVLAMELQVFTGYCIVCGGSSVQYVLFGYAQCF